MAEFPDAASEIAAIDAAERILGERQWPVTITLAHPFEFGKGELVSSLTFRRGRMGDLKGVKPDGIPSMDQLMLIASRMCGKPVALLDMLEDEDGSEVVAIAMGFFARSLGAGKKT